MNSLANHYLLLSELNMQHCGRSTSICNEQTCTPGPMLWEMLRCLLIFSRTTKPHEAQLHATVALDVRVHATLEMSGCHGVAHLVFIPHK